MNRLAWKLRVVWWRVKNWLDQILPIVCNCGHLCAKKNVKVETTTWGTQVGFCPKCHEDRFG